MKSLAVTYRHPEIAIAIAIVKSLVRTLGFRSGVIFDDFDV